MSGKPAARVTDPTACPQNGHGSNPIVQGSADVLFDGLPAARQGDATACGGTLSGKLIHNVLINGRPAAVLGSQGEHGNRVVGGSATVIIGTTQAAAFVAVTPSAAQARTRPVFPVADAWQAPPGEPMAAELEEEEEEEELEDERLQGIVLRIGMFFDGTGNNLGNSAVTERCRRDDRELLDERTLAETVAHCAAYGYRDGVSPDDSYGNAASNVALLYELYRDDSIRRLGPAERRAALAVYLEGIGTRSGGSDSVVGSASGLGETGVLERVRQSAMAIRYQLDRLCKGNPDLQISRIEFDLFGFSRGAAAARHFANEVLKDQGGVLQASLNARVPGFASDFSWARTRLNFIGLFDCVAAIVAPQSGDWSPLDKLNPGVNLYLPPGCAGQVVQLVARDERRWNFALNSVRSGALAAGQTQHREIVLPGVHSDLGGGYPALMEERLLLGRPRVSQVPLGHPPQRTAAWLDCERERQGWLALGLPGDGELNVDCRVGPGQFIAHGGGVREQRVYAALGIRRRVRGELSFVYLRIMRELAVRHGVPFKLIPTTRQLALPSELQSIADKLLTDALEGTCSLSEEDERLLRARYIHLSAHWTPHYGLLLSKPVPNRRLAYNNVPQEGYPQ